MQEKFIEIKNLNKTYRGKIKALKNVSLDIYQGEVLALIGLNGAGKSTLVKILLQLVIPDSGEILFNTKLFDRSGIKNSIAYLPELFRIPPDMKAYTFLKYMGELSGLNKSEIQKKIIDISHTLQLEKWLNKPAKKFSKGMMLKLGIAQTLLDDYLLYVLDEPTEGLDPIARRTVRDIIKSLRDKGCTFIINSHMLSEIELVADRFAIIHQGEIINIGKVNELLRGKPVYEVVANVNPNLTQWQFYEYNSLWKCSVSTPEELNLLLNDLNNSSVKVHNISMNTLNLEDLFLQNIFARDVDNNKN